MAEELEQNSDNFEQQNSDDFADNYLSVSNFSMSQLKDQLPFSASTPHSLSEFRNSGWSGTLFSPTPMTGSLDMGVMSIKKSSRLEMDCRQDSSTTNAPDPLAGVFQSDSTVGPDIWYKAGSTGIYHSIMGDYLDFSAGTYSYAIANPSPALYITGYSFTMEAWIRPDNFNSGNFNTNAIMMRGGNGLKGDLATTQSTSSTGKVRFRWTGADSGLQSSSTLSAFTWYHVVGVYHVYNYVSSGNSANSGIAAIFINGSLDSSVSLSGYRVATTNGSTSLMSFGFYNSQNVSTLNPSPSPTYKFFYNGRMGHVRFYNGAITPAQVLQNYNASKGYYVGGSNSGSVFS